MSWGCLAGLILVFSTPGLISAAVVWPLLRPKFRPIAALVLSVMTLLFLGLAWSVGVFNRRINGSPAHPSSGEATPAIDGDTRRTES